MIPKIIHQTWKDENIPYDTFKKEWIESWTNLNPTWEYKLWTDKDIKIFLENKFPWFMERFNEYPKNIQRVDAFRYFVLYEYGGLYADMDFECFKNIDGITEQNYNLMLSREHDHLKNSSSLLYRCFPTKSTNFGNTYLK
jgi:mannosyltransferase OCH1-like enzyme